MENGYFYFLARRSSVAVEHYVFTRQQMSDLNSSTLYSKISVPKTELYGFCLRNAQLDFVIGFNTEFNELRLITLKENLIDAQWETKNYQVIQKNLNITDQIVVDCRWDSDGYRIGVAATYYEAANTDYGYYVSLFDTAANVTQWYHSTDNGMQGVSERVKDVRVDLPSDQLLVVFESNKNAYISGRSVYEPGADPGEDNPNIVLAAFRLHDGERVWWTVLGDPNFVDSYSQLQIWGNHLYVLLTSYTTTYNSSVNTDIYFYRIRAENGFIDSKQVLGSPTADVALDMQITSQGIYILARIGTSFLPHAGGKIYQTQNSTDNLAMILMKFAATADAENTIVEIEGYDINAIVPSPYPKRMFPYVINDYQSGWLLMSTRSDTSSSGVYFTIFNNATALFVKGQIFCANSACNSCNN